MDELLVVESAPGGLSNTLSEDVISVSPGADIIGRYLHGGRRGHIELEQYSY